MASCLLPSRLLRFRFPNTAGRDVGLLVPRPVAPCKVVGRWIHSTAGTGKLLYILHMHLFRSPQEIISFVKWFD